MATETSAASTPAAARARPYAPSWLNLLLDGIERLPGPSWLAYGVIAVIGVIGSNAQGWTSGFTEPGQLDPVFTFWGVFPIALLWVVGYLDRVAQQCLEAFRPALDASDVEIERMRYELTTAPGRPAAALLLAAVPITLAYYVADPVTSGVDVLSPAGLAVRATVESLVSGVFFVMIYQLSRQLRQVRRVLGRARVDLFAPAPLYAFSRFTARFGIAIIVLTESGFAVAPPPVDSESFLVLWAPWIFGVPLLAAVAFVYPLMGMHARLVAEKDRLQGEAEERLKSLLGELNRDVDTRDLARADALNKTLASLLAQRDVLARLPTWPWSAGTFRGLVTAILLPLGLFLVQRVLVQFL